MFSLRSRCLLLVSLLLLCISAPAQTTCPWLTQGTAATWLQGPATVSTNLLSANEGTCTFTLHQDNALYTLEITVSATNHPRCPASSKPLTGIGNEAILCAANHSRNQTTDTITSRIRDRYLTVQLTITAKNTNPMPPDQRQAIVQQAAEEVAGNLY
jgi:hypothetical protein